MNDDKLKSLFNVYEAREPGRAYVEPFNDANGNQRGWKASTKWGRVKYFGKDFKSSAEKHAGIDSSDNVNDRGMDEDTYVSEGAKSTAVKSVARGAGRIAGPAFVAYDMYDKVKNQKKSVTRAAAETGAGLAAGYAGAQGGAALGALGGPLAPVTVPAGALAGGIFGYYAGDRIASAAADRVASPRSRARVMREAAEKKEVANAEKITTDPNKPTSRFWGSNSLTNIYKKDTPGQSSLSESYELAFDYQGKPSIAPTAGNLMMQAQGAFAHHNDVQNVMDVRAIKESIEKTFQNTVLEEDAEQLEAKCEILQDMVEHALATIEEIKGTNVERDAWSTAEIMKLERYIESVNAYVINILEDGDIVADAVGVVVPSFSYTDPRTGKYVTRKGRTVKRKSRRKIGSDDDRSNDEPKGPVSV